MTYRYTLRRRWLGSGGIVNWIMLNPSTADDVFDDPTIRKCCGFSKRWRFAGLVVTNLFAARSTDPLELKSLRGVDIVGSDNDRAILDEAARASVVVVAWGDHGTWLGRDVEVLKLLSVHRIRSDSPILCIGKTRSGNPLHPSRCGYTEAPVAFRLPQEDSNHAALVRP